MFGAMLDRIKPTTVEYRLKNIEKDVEDLLAMVTNELSRKENFQSNLNMLNNDFINGIQKIWKELVDIKAKILDGDSYVDFVADWCEALTDDMESIGKRLTALERPAKKVKKSATNNRRKKTKA